jgi:opacity protein-like surface antigen
MHIPWQGSLAIGFVLIVALSSAPASADVWDNDPGNEDDSSATDNEIFHGTVQVHDLASQGGVPDQDWYVVSSRPFSSYEVLVDGLQGEIWAAGSSLPVDRVNAAGSVLTPGGTPPDGLGSSRSVRWANNTALVISDYVRVDGVNTACGTGCTTNAQYTIRMWETTASIPRFNNSGSQVTVLLLHNPTNYTITGTVYFWENGGAFLASAAFVLGAKQLFVFNSSTVAPGFAGAITVTHNGRFGDLQGKSVALDPSTGFSFDTPLSYRPH